MSHHIYHTRGLILGSIPTGESNRFYKIFTEDLGLVGATAQAVREGKSKLRYSLQDLSWVHLDLVHGREVWRITSAIEAEREMRNAEYGVLFARVCALVRRLLHGEGQNSALFKELVAITEFLERESVALDDRVSFEALAAMRVLAHLGYFNTEHYKDFTIARMWSRELLEAFGRVRPTAIRDINRALKETHL